MRVKEDGVSDDKLYGSDKYALDVAYAAGVADERARVQKALDAEWFAAFAVTPRAAIESIRRRIGS